MSWCGGGLIRPTPGVECRVLAIHGYTLCPGSCPPSPGLAPCAILICSSSALTRYSTVTPKRPDATCLIALRRSTGAPSAHVAPSGLNRRGSSPPSPVLDFPPILFIAIARFSCASVLIDPSDIAPVQNRLTISLAGSTSSIGTGGRRPLRKFSSPRSVQRCRASSSTSLVYSLNVL